jgi:hypothetical protein
MALDAGLIPELDLVLALDVVLVEIAFAFLVYFTLGIIINYNLLINQISYND